MDGIGTDMSWDISLHIDTGGPDPACVYDCGNMTYNVNSMYAKALNIESFSDFLHGKICSELLPALAQGYSDMLTNPDAYRALTPENGWGNYESALEFLEAIIKGCRLHPKAFIHVG